MARSSIERIVVQRLAHQLVTQRLVDRVYNQPLIGNVERGAYVECMIELALSELRPPWSLTGTWASWDLEQAESEARIEIKQSAALQTWAGPALGHRRHSISRLAAATTPTTTAGGWQAEPRSGTPIST